VSGLLEDSHGLVCRFFDERLEVTARVAFGEGGELLKVIFGQMVVDLAELTLEHAIPGIVLWERNVYSELKSSAHGEVKCLWEVRSSQDQYSVLLISNAFHLSQKLTFDSLCSIILVLRSGTAQGIDLVDEDDRGFPLSGKVEEGADHLLALAHILAQYFGGFDGEEGCVGFCGASFGEEGLACARRTI
jgi:hypothetical protein